jgi:hypothetical protein
VEGVYITEAVSEIRYLINDLIKLKLYAGEIRNKLISGNACYRSVWNCLPSRMPKSVYNKIYRILAFLIILYSFDI